MRLIGHLANEAHARAIGDYLYTQGIENDVEPEADGQWALWVRSEDQLERADALLGQFRLNPGDPKYVRAAEAARDRREMDNQKKVAAERRFFDRRRLFPGGAYGVGVVTGTLIALSIVVTLITSFGDNSLFPQYFAISFFGQEGRLIRWQPALVDVRQGQIWRLFTPMFVHMGVVHILFNMMWLKDLGSMIEHRQGKLTLVALALFISGTSNAAQFFTHGPDFGGMSGVVYGLFGYVWVRGRFDPASGLHMDRVNQILMVVWFFLCLFGVIPNVANTVHAVGLALGMVIGFLSAQWAIRPR
jgi:GlpG protein